MPSFTKEFKKIANIKFLFSLLVLWSFKTLKITFHDITKGYLCNVTCIVYLLVYAYLAFRIKEMF